MAVLQIIMTMDEAYLTTLSNKGTYKRAVKELESTDISIDITDSLISAAFPDGTEVKISENIKDYSCSCPARDVCKHLLMAILAAQATQGGEQVSAEQPSFDKLLTENIQSLEKKTGKKLFKKAVFQLEMDSTAQIDEGSTLAIALSSGFAVHFLPNTPVEASKCSCKKPEMCEHRAEAVLHYIKHKTGSFPEGLFDKEQTSSTEADTDIIPFMLDFAHRFMLTGLARASGEYRKQFEHLGVLCHSRRLANHERLCRRIAGQLEHMEQHSASFNINALLSYLCDFINLCKAIEAGHNGADIIGVFRDEYFMIPDVTLHGLGAEAWESIGGYRGITAYFYCTELSKFVYYTAAMPIERAPALTITYSSELWGSTLATAAKSSLTLHHGKLSQQNQLSASSEAEAFSIKSLDSDAISAIEVTDFSTLPDILWSAQGTKPNAEAVLAEYSYGDAEFDEIRQELKLPVTDKHGNTLTLTIRYKDFMKKLIDNTKYFASRSSKVGRMLVRLYIEDGRMKAYPISVIEQDNIFNLSIDDVSGGPKSSKYYNW